jgi:hypothetical protein
MIQVVEIYTVLFKNLFVLTSEILDEDIIIKALKDF